VVDVEQWAEVRRLFFVRGLSQREIHRRTGLHRDTIRKAINSETRRSTSARRPVQA
jgi:DNA invertase Pin-like site-specific DNA recombinase